MKNKILAFLLLFSIMLSVAFANITVFASLSYSNYQTVNVDSYQSFRNSVYEKAYNTDGDHGAQCWDGANILWLRATGRVLQTGNGYARGCWQNMRDANAGTEFELITNISSVKRGDVVVFSEYSPTGHIAFADEDYNGSGSLSVLGQNQTNRSKVTSYDSDGSCWEGAFSVTSWNVSSFLGAFRYKGWNGGNDSQAATLSLEKQNYLTNEHVTFYYSTSLAHSHYNVKIFKNNQLTEIISTSNRFDVRYFSEPGTYSAYFEVVNNNNVIDTSNTIYFTVQQEYTKPSNVQLALEKNTFNVGEHTTFYPDGNYVLYYIVTVYKDGNVYESVKINPYSYYTNSYKEIGNYIAYAEAYNASGIVYSNNVEFIVQAPMPSIHGTLQLEENNIKITVSPINVSNGIIIIAGYNNDKLISFQLEDSIQENSTHTLSSNIDKVKLMVWSDLKSMSPVCSPVTIGVKE